jgi:hypothetical protein
VANYQPPEQSRRSQLIDAATILVLIFATLFGTTYLVEESSSTTATSDSSRPVANLPVNNTERAQYERLISSETTDLATVNAAVDSTQNQSDKYEINIWALLGTAALLALYLGFVYRTSFKEYREVIEERFGPGDERRLS